MMQTLLLGNNLAIMVACFELGRAGKSVALLTDGKPLGGHFRGVQIQNYDFDIGMVLLEQSISSGTGEQLSTYKPTNRNDWLRFGDRAANWLSQQTQLKRISTPLTWVCGRFVPDYLISNSLNSCLGFEPPAAIDLDDPFHPSHKNNPGVYDELTYSEAVKINHDECWHKKYVDPFIKKLTAGNADRILARYHRAIWAPLYYPETLALASRGLQTELSEYPFWTTPTGCIGHLIANLEMQLRSMPNVSIIRGQITTLDEQNGNWIAIAGEEMIDPTNQVGIGLPPTRLGELRNFSILTADQGADITMLFALVPSALIPSDFGCVMVADSQHASYRLTDQDGLAGLDPELHRVVVEASTSYLRELYPCPNEEQVLVRELCEILGIVSADCSKIQILRCVSIAKAVALPSAEQIEIEKMNSTAIAKHTSGAHLSGALLGFGVSSINDQVIQGLKMYEEFCES